MAARKSETATLLHGEPCPVDGVRFLAHLLPTPLRPSSPPAHAPRFVQRSSAHRPRSTACEKPWSSRTVGFCAEPLGVLGGLRFVSLREAWGAWRARSTQGIGGMGDVCIWRFVSGEMAMFVSSEKSPTEPCSKAPCASGGDAPRVQSENADAGLDRVSVNGHRVSRTLSFDLAAAM